MSCHRVPKLGRGEAAGSGGGRPRQEINTSPSSFSLCNGLDITSPVGHYVGPDNKSVLLALLSVSRAHVYVCVCVCAERCVLRAVDGFAFTV